MWIYILFISLAAAFFIYCLIPSYWARNHAPGVLRRGDPKYPWIALTFDDGPNPDYTPRLLNILKEQNVPATFFLVGQRAIRHPELVKLIEAEGHTIGCHSFTHRHAWLMDPITTHRDMTQTFNAVKNILGKPPKWYRPPWGTFNLLSIFEARKLNLFPAYWCIEAQDWAAGTSVDHIYNTVLNKAAPGAIVLLHDNGGAPGAPEKTLKALPTIIDRLKERGFTFVTLDQMKGVTDD